ncbi:hypothetical protein SLEP1_g59537 [Rubroshorea leprosula]|uniref:Uncharacterized protein n=1 Tax=Rubroshorea leprosula TaxID=152421 RepID=A0AAV5MTS3_9ROSI|nr:hypothetical protein SLEP1_g59537 [Rubroshorea leprosula]
MISLGCYDIYDILSPEVVNSTRNWSASMIQMATELCTNSMNVIMQDTGRTLQTDGDITLGVGTSPETGPFDPLGIREEEKEIRVGGIHKVVLIKVVSVCLATCLLSTISYTTVCGTM